MSQQNQATDHAAASMVVYPREVTVYPARLEPYVEAEEAAKFVRMSPRHLKKLAREGKLPAHSRGGGQRRRWLFLLSELDQWLRSQVNSPCDPCRETRSIQ